MAVTFQSHTFANQSNGTSVVVNAPTGVANGDLLLMRIDGSSNSNYSPPAGWTTIEIHKTCTTSNACTGQNVFWRIASSEPASYTCTADAAQTFGATVWRITGHDATTPIHAWSGQDGTGQTWTNTGVTTSVANCLLVYWGSESTAASTTISATADPTGFTNVNPLVDFIIPGIGSYKAFVGPGATGSVAGTATGGAAGERYVAHLIAIAPAGSSTVNLSGASNTALPPKGSLSRGKLYHAVFEGFVAGPLLFEGLAPVTNQIDVPTIDRRHAQVCFQGWFWSGIIAPNYPGYQWIDAPPARLRRGHQYQGEQRQPIPKEYDLGTNWTEPAQGFTRWRKHSFVGWRSQNFLNAPEEIHGKRQWANPPQGRFAQWGRMALSFDNRQISNIPNTTRGPSLIWLPLVGVTSTTNKPVGVSLVLAKNGPAYVPYENRARALRRFDFSGVQWWKIIDSPSPPIVATDLPVRGRRHDYGGWAWWKIIDSPNPPIVSTALPVVDPRRRHSFVGWSAWQSQNAALQPQWSFPDVMPRYRRGYSFDGWLAWQQADIPTQFQWTEVLFGRSLRWTPPQFTAGPVIADQSLLTAQSLTAVHAFSTRRLRDAYAGKCMNVRRDSDSTTQDIGFNGDGDLDSAALLSFVGAGSGFVHIWYDQSGNGNDMTQATTAAQPRVVLTGTQDTMGASPPRAAVFFDGVAMTMKTANGALGAQPFTVSCAVKYLKAGDTGTPDIFGSGLNTNCQLYSHSANSTQGTADFNCGVDDQYLSAIVNNSLHTLAGMINSTSSRTYNDGTAHTAQSCGTNTWTGLTVGARQNGAQFGNYLIPEAITFSGDITDAKILNIQSNQKTYWGTT